jgi:hypothetical protein
MRIKALFDLAGIAKGGSNAVSHRFRDTFAVGLLQSGVPLERVSVLLGHSSIKVTEKHYSAWTKARQEQLEADVARTWSAGELLDEKSLPAENRGYKKGTVGKPRHKLNKKPNKNDWF